MILPSPKIELPTGEFYNPFVMPEEAWEGADTIYLKISQGADGDYHSEKLGGARTVGIYASTDKGKTFEFIREEAKHSMNALGAHGEWCVVFQQNVR